MPMSDGGSNWRVVSPEDFKIGPDGVKRIEVVMFRYFPRPTGMHVEWWLYGKLVSRAEAVEFLGEESVARSEKQAADDFKKYMDTLA
jgi:hypothetical protein